MKRQIISFFCVFSCGIAVAFAFTITITTKLGGYRLYDTLYIRGRVCIICATIVPVIVVVVISIIIGIGISIIIGIGIGDIGIWGGVVVIQAYDGAERYCRNDD